jgi:hypothetical protein
MMDKLLAVASAKMSAALLVRTKAVMLGYLTVVMWVEYLETSKVDKKAV